MDLSDLVSLDGIVPSLKVQSKKLVIQELASRAAQITGLPEREIYETLYEREQLGSTGVGHGVAIPHGKVAGLKRLIGVFIRLERPVEFDSIDDQPVDLVIALLGPEGAGADHLKALALVARLLRDKPVANKLRASQDRDAIYSILTQSVTNKAA